MRKFIFLIPLLFAVTAHAQTDALNLPTALYVLLNEGVVQRYGQGTAGVQQVTPNDAFVIDFGISPDGAWIAYRTEETLTVRDLFGERETVLSTEPGFPTLRGGGHTVAWSPDGGAIATTTETGLRIYTRTTSRTPTVTDIPNDLGEQGFFEVAWSPDGAYIAGTDETGVWQIYRDGALVSLTPAANDLLWLSASEVAFASSEGGLVRMNLALANQQTDILPATAIYDVLVLRPNGELAAFRRPQFAEAGSGTYTRINPVEGREDVVGEVSLVLDGLGWTPDGAFAVAFEGGVLVLVNPEDGVGFTLPITGAVAYAWGAELLPAVETYPLPRSLFFLAPDNRGVAQVWQMPTDGTPPFPLTEAESRITGYDVAPTAVTYSSNSRLWVRRFDNTDAVELATLDDDIDAAPDFSADGRTIAFEDGGVWVVPVSGELPTLLAANTDERTFRRPRYAPDRNALLVDVIYEDGASTGVLDVASGELMELPFGYRNGAWLSLGRILTFAERSAQTQAGVQITSVDTLTSEVVLPETVSVRDVVTVPRAGGEDWRVIVGSGAPYGPQAVSVADFRDIAGLIPVWEGSFLQNPQLAPDGSLVAGTFGGQLSLLNVATGEQVVVGQWQPVSQVRWQIE